MAAKEMDLDLGETDDDESFIFPPAERKVITQPLDLSVQTLVEQWTTKQLVLPEIQREYVWDNAKASRLIESLLLNIPIPVLYFAETDEAKYEIFDGHQRVRSIVNYLGGVYALSGLAVLREYRGMRYLELPDREQRFLRMRTLRTILISIESHPNMKFEIYERLNTGSISLNAQELRNSIYRGAFNDMLHELAKDTAFRSLIGTKVPRKRMVDEEAILRFFAMRDRLNAYKTPLKKFLNEYMASVRAATPQQIEQYRATFTRAVGNASALLGGSAFRVLGSNGQPSEAAVNRALLESQLLACSWIAGENLPSASDVKRKMASLFKDEGFTDAVQRATGDRSRTLKRARDTVAVMLDAGAEMEVPHNLNQ
ncbi:conserved protein of unknown function [Bradyrhizobium sp. ORS 285]|uniref:DUF262 domain-containing protein n=1 Tax=Bradyrhizobium sp. ORS 285 TaxID=115808 RepID=UPI0002407876|nr:DUF262 domain-containing protein [Bradyrhizobium sp. ORS 285]CCD85562.1 conserved hypothetical protein [Bradyrhizobium sp. ORS 285]SMX55529.1 conserved protein of unknown function [Bradyrhizobium sp. ORS 285]